MGEIDNHGYNFELLVNFPIRGELVSGGGELSLRISAPQLLRFGINSVLNILNKRMTYSMNESINESQKCLWNSPGYTGSGKQKNKGVTVDNNFYLKRILEYL